MELPLFLSCNRALFVSSDMSLRDENTDARSDAHILLIVTSGKVVIIQLVVQVYSLFVHLWNVLKMFCWRRVSKYDASSRTLDII